MAKNVRLHPLVQARLGELQTALESEIGVTATQEEIVAALVHATTAPTLAVLVPVFKRYAANATAHEDGV